MKGNLIKSLFLVINLVATVIMVSCNKDEEKSPPSISFKMGSKYTYDGEVVMVGSPLIFGVQAAAKDANITNFTIKKILPDGSSFVVMDTALNAPSLDVDKVIYQSIEDQVNWVFTVMDKNRLSANISCTVFKDPDSEFGDIFYYPSITMGYQNNTKYGHFLNPFTGKVYFEDSATILQEEMHFLVYYIVDQDLPSPVFSSPGEMDNFSEEALLFYPYISDWQTRRFTHWDIRVDDVPISVEAFDQAENDSLLIVSYQEVWGKKKFKWATNDRVIPFKTANGKFGLVKVINAELTESGKIEFAIKIQD
jgi:hypothetical protein